MGELRTSPVKSVQVVVPEGIDDPMRPSGGNVYDRRLTHGLRAMGWSVHEHAVAGAWPSPDRVDREAAGHLLRSLPDGEVVLLDGLVASAVPDLLAPHAERVRIVVLVHLPLGVDDPTRRSSEHAALAAAAAVVATSAWSGQWLAEHYALPDVHIARPGVDPADLAPASMDGERILSVGAVVRGKGQDLLVSALAAVAHLRWQCRVVGTLERDPGFVEHLHCLVDRAAIADRVHFTGPLTGTDLEASYAGADLLVLASRTETYGMVVTEALARGIPVIAAGVGGVPDTLGHNPDGTRPGVLVRPGDPEDLAVALRHWLVDPGHRAELGQAARARRPGLAAWSQTAAQVSDVLAEVAREKTG
jgi:glycosyltransferase involved in cell wall biosynthesis